MPAGMRQLGEEERLALIDSLKAKWDEVNRKYQLTYLQTYLLTYLQVNRKYQSSSVLSLASLDTIGKVRSRRLIIMISATYYHDLGAFLSRSRVHLTR